MSQDRKDTAPIRNNSAADSSRVAALESEIQRLRGERVLYARLHALTGNFICVYVVDPETDSYREFSATDDYVNSFAQAKNGTDFFGTVRKAAGIMVSG